MSWKNHLNEDDREDLDSKTLEHLAQLVRMAFVSGLWAAGNKARETQKLAPIRRPPGMKHNLEKQLDRWIENVVTELYQRSGRPGFEHLTWLELQFSSLKEAAKNAFKSHS